MEAKRLDTAAMDQRLSSVVPYRGVMPRIHPSAFIADGARIIGDVEIGEDCSIWFNAVLRGDVNTIRIGDRTNIQDNVVIHVTKHVYPVTVGTDNTVGHSVVLHGCTIGSHNLIGMGSKILDGVKVGSYCLVAAGSLLLEGFEVPDGVLVAGLPAKVKRRVTEEEMRFFESASQQYIHEAQQYRTNNREESL